MACSPVPAPPWHLRFRFAWRKGEALLRGGHSAEKNGMTTKHSTRNSLSTQHSSGAGTCIHSRLYYVCWGDTINETLHTQRTSISVTSNISHTAERENGSLIYWTDLCSARSYSPWNVSPRLPPLSLVPSVSNTAGKVSPGWGAYSPGRAHSCWRLGFAPLFPNDMPLINLLLKGISCRGGLFWVIGLVIYLFWRRGRKRTMKRKFMGHTWHDTDFFPFLSIYI